MNALKRLFYALLLVSLAPIGASAEEGGLTVGAKMNIYSRWDGMVGVGPMVMYSLTDHLRFESALLFLTKEGASVDWSNEVQVPFRLSSALEVYPLAGISLNDPYKFGVAFGFGGGAVYNINDRWGVNGGVKWNIQTQEFVKNPLVISVGVACKL